MTGLKDWSTTAASNNAAPPNGWPEGMNVNTVNNTGRQNMADVRAWYEDAEWINFGAAHAATYASGTTFTVTGDLTAKYHAGRRVRAVGSSTGTIYGTITGSVFSTSTTVTVSWDSGSLSNESLAISLHILSQDTSAPAVAARSGTKLVFPGISAAPKGWTIDATNDNSALRLRSSASTSTGGSVDFTTAFAAARTSDSHTLTSDEMPSHTHTITPSDGRTWFGKINATAGGVGDGTVATSAGTSIGSVVTQTITPSGSLTATAANTGGGSGHTHGLPSFAVKYVDSCICTKV